MGCRRDGWAEHTGSYGYSVSSHGQGDCDDGNSGVYPAFNLPDTSIKIVMVPWEQIPKVDPSPNEPVQISVGGEHACAVTDYKQLFCWEITMKDNCILLLQFR